MRVAIATVQVPYLSGGAEALAQGLAGAIGARGHPVEIVTAPFRFFPPAEVERSMQLWATEDFTRLNFYEPDRVICLKFPAYGLEHPSKALWLCHQHRASYELLAADAAAAERSLAARVRDFDARTLPRLAPRYTISRRVSERLQRACGIDSAPLYHPPPLAAEHYSASAEPYVFFPSRIEHAKRQDLLVRAMVAVRSPACAVFAGEGGQAGAMHELARELGVEDRVRFVGRVSKEEMLALYARAAVVCFPPLDEDYGYVTLEAMLSAKPVVTCTDSGGPLEFVVDGETGRVVEPHPEAIALALDAILGQPAKAARMGRQALARYREMVPPWENVVDALLA